MASAAAGDGACSLAACRMAAAWATAAAERRDREMVAESRSATVVSVVLRERLLVSCGGDASASAASAELRAACTCSRYAG